MRMLMVVMVVVIMIMGMFMVMIVCVIMSIMYDNVGAKIGVAVFFADFAMQMIVGVIMKMNMHVFMAVGPMAVAMGV